MNKNLHHNNGNIPTFWRDDVLMLHTATTSLATGTRNISTGLAPWWSWFPKGKRLPSERLWREDCNNKRGIYNKLICYYVCEESQESCEDNSTAILCSKLKSFVKNIYWKLAEPHCSYQRNALKYCNVILIDIIITKVTSWDVWSQRFSVYTDIKHREAANLHNSEASAWVFLRFLLEKICKWSIDD